MNTLTHKGYGRIYCEDEDDIEEVRDIIKSLDEFEYSYLPTNLIAPFTEYPKVVYTHKFSDLDMDRLTAECWKQGLRVWVFDAGYTEYPVE